MSDRDPAEIRRQFRDDHEFALAPLRAAVLANYESATKFAESGIKALFALNGGGLIALPTFAALFKTDLHGATALILCAAAGMFVLGLIGAALTCLCGYLSAMMATESTNHNVRAVSLKYSRHYQQISETPTIADEIKAVEDAVAKGEARFLQIRKLAVVFGAASLAAFTVGACLALWAFVPWATRWDVPMLS
jgi:hypothetical protein